MSARYIALTMANYKTLYKCRVCGTTTYQRVVGRAANGTLEPTGEYRCTGCRNVFASLRAWWEPPRSSDFQPSKFSSA